MKKTMMLVGGVVALLPSLTWGADVVNGWTGQTKIVKLVSGHSQTLIQLSGISNGCGHSSYWSLLIGQQASDEKLSLLMTAYLSGKFVNLRCESSRITDFELY